MTNLEAARAIYDAVYGLDAHEHAEAEAAEWADDAGGDGAALAKTAETLDDWLANGWVVESVKGGATVIERRVGTSRSGRPITKLAYIADCGDYRLVHVE